MIFLPLAHRLTLRARRPGRRDLCHAVMICDWQWHVNAIAIFVFAIQGLQIHGLSTHLSRWWKELWMPIRQA